MAGSFTEKDTVRCEHYARFASHLTRSEFDYIYWFLFVLVLSMLFLASWYWSKTNDAVDKYSAQSPEHRQYMRRCLLVCLACFLVASASLVMEIFVLMALQFCDGEDLMAIYWSTWTTLQLGATIAIAGVALAVIHSYRGRKHPPWGLALGTPVLVVAGLGHFFHHTVKNVWAKKRGEDTLPISQAVTQNTLVEEQSEAGGPARSIGSADPNCLGHVAGFANDGGPILVLHESPRPMPPCASLLGQDNQGRYIVVFRRESVKLEMRGEEEGRTSQAGGGVGCAGEEGKRESAAKKDVEKSADKDVEKGLKGQ